MTFGAATRATTAAADRSADGERAVNTQPLRATTCRTVDELRAIRELWLELSTDAIWADPDFFEMTLRTDPHAVRPHVVLVSRGDEPLALAIARLETIELAARVGYAKLLQSRVRSLTTVYRGILGDPDEPTLAFLLAELRRALADGEADVITLRHLEVGSIAHRLATQSPGWLCRQHVSRLNVHWELDLPASYDEFLRTRSSNTRDQLKRYVRKLERELGSRAEIRVYADPSEIDEMFQAIDRIAVTTYQHALGVAFHDTPRWREHAALCLERGWFRAWVLTIDEEPAAWWHAEIYRGRLTTGRPGYVPEWAHLRIGTVLMCRVIEDACAEPGVMIVDHGVGDAEYKRKYASRSREETDVLVFAPRLRPIRVNLTRTLALGFSQGLTNLSRRTGVYTKVKQRWRARLRSAAADPAGTGAE
jgi:hypothetical protein